jgi:hypothetical protein
MVSAHSQIYRSSQPQCSCQHKRNTMQSLVFVDVQSTVMERLLQGVCEQKLNKDAIHFTAKIRMNLCSVSHTRVGSVIEIRLGIIAPYPYSRST